MIRKGTIYGLLVGALPYITMAAITSPSKYTSIEELLKAIVDAVAQFGLPIAGLYIVWVGFKFVSAGGNERALDEAKTGFLYAVGGATLILGAKVVVDTIIDTIKGL
ncbi:MAG: TrbC/VirB2 family protein [Candidatus Paceibacterota bacterium]|jgi:hypothetical protein